MFLVCGRLILRKIRKAAILFNIVVMLHSGRLGDVSAGRGKGLVCLLIVGDRELPVTVVVAITTLVFAA